MNDETTTLDQADEDVLAYTVSDEALEAAMPAAASNVAGPSFWAFDLFHKC